jgi:dihydroorotase
VPKKEIMKTLLIKDATIVNEGTSFLGSVLIEGDKIKNIYRGSELPSDLCPMSTLDASGKMLIPGVIDDQVHFRQPGLTYKADIHTESMAAVAGGVTSYMEMPNTIPQTITQQLLTEKYELGEMFSLANYSFYLGATNDNLNEILKTNPKNVCGVKVFMGSSTGNMLVDDQKTLEGIFKESPLLVAVHCEDESVVKRNFEKYSQLFGEDISIQYHPLIRSAEACYISTSKAIEMSSKFGTRLHVLHLSSNKEMGLFRNGVPSIEKQITSEVCVHHLWFCENDYQQYGTKIKWNPSIKYEEDRDGLWVALLDGRLDVIATDHAPHTNEEKNNKYQKAPSGGPLVQHSLVAMLDFVSQQKISIERVVEKMCHAPADIYRLQKRGYIKTGYYADIVLIDVAKPWTVEKENIISKCGWSPFEGHTFGTSVTHTFVNGNLVFENGRIDGSFRGSRLLFDR